MIGLLQRVTHARVTVAGAAIAGIEQGLLVLVGVERGDGAQQARRLAERLLAYRVFGDAEGRMNRSLHDVQGELLLVPQFTLAADTTRGNRPGFSTAAPPAEGERLFTALVETVAELGQPAQTGHFGADMQVTLCNDGPVTFWLRVPP